jgi:hypothetical protein
MSQYFGIASVPLIKQLVDIAKPSNGLLAVIYSLLLGMVFNVLLAISVGNDIVNALAVGAVCGLLSNIYNDSREVIEKMK